VTLLKEKSHLFLKTSVNIHCLFSNLTQTPPFGIPCKLKGSATKVLGIFGLGFILKFLTMWAKPILDIRRANRIPTQFLGPWPNPKN